MAAMLSVGFCLALVSYTCAYPYFDPDRWSPQDIAAYLLQSAAEQEIIPVDDESFNTDNQGIGMASAVDLDSNGDLYLFHRANRPWTADTFQEKGNVLTDAAREPIKDNTIFKLNPKTGKVIKSFGGDLFNVPHGLTVDNNDNLWVTDVGRHQVLRIPKGSEKPDLVLGEKFVPGNDEAHFCKPTDVAVASNGDFFVADGYCNNRIVKFSKDLKPLATWGTEASSYGLTPNTLEVPHSLTLVEDLDLVCVADRENGRALCYNAGLTSDRAVGSFNRTLVPQGDTGRVFAVYYNKADKDVAVAADISQIPYLEDDEEVFPPRAFLYDPNGQQEAAWAEITLSTARSGPSLIHDLCVSKDGQDYYLADVLQRKVLKYSRRS